MYIVSKYIGKFNVCIRGLAEVGERLRLGEFKTLMGRLLYRTHLAESLGSDSS